MKLTTSPRSAVTAPASMVRVVLSTKDATHLKKDGSATTLVFHIGKDPLTPRTYRTTIRHIVRTAKGLKLDRLALDFGALASADITGTLGRAWALSALAENLVIAHYEFDRYRSKKSGDTLKEIMICDVKAGDKQALASGELIGTYVNHCRDIANTPGGDMTPTTLADAAVKTAMGSGVSVKVLNERGIKALNMGALLGVAKGSTEAPRFIIMEYWGGGRSKKGKDAPIVFVGKGVTFDTGGVNIKPSEAVLDMHLDMSGGASVIAAVTLAAKLKLKKNIVGLIPAAENMVSGSSYRPGDVLTSMKGITIDVLNTDAEGRLILADALTYAERYKPRLVVDIATLTGAALVALGLHASAIMSKDMDLLDRVREWGEASGDYVWPLPLWNEYKQYTKGVHGDIANIPSSHSRYGGSINGGMFLSHFTDKYPWVHIDMAPRMTAAPGDHLAKGAAGEPVRLLLTIAERY